MNKAELITSMSEKNNLSKKDNEIFLKAFLETVEEVLSKKEKIQLVGFGTFETKFREARDGRNPKTKEVIRIESTYAPTFKAGKSLKEKINK